MPTTAPPAPPAKLVIATRASRLALAQAREIQTRLQALYPACAVSLVELTTRGDRILDRSLAKVGGKGLFVKELEAALLDGRADLAVHSLKDVPVDLAPAFALAAITARADPRDALVAPDHALVAPDHAFVCNHHATLADLPAGAVVGTSSLRREAQLRARHPDLVVRPLRGNVDTRLAKLDAGDCDAIVLAAAGLQRLGLAARIRSLFSPEDSLPAAGQGALALQVLAERADLHRWLSPLACATSTACGLAERAVSRVLGGSCQVPLAAYAVPDDAPSPPTPLPHAGEGTTNAADHSPLPRGGRGAGGEGVVHLPAGAGEGQPQEPLLFLRALVATPDGSRILRAQARGAARCAEQLGEQVAHELLAAGADRLLAELLGADAPPVARPTAPRAG